MGLRHASTQLVTVEWLKTLEGIPSNGVATTVPQNRDLWEAEGFVQPVVTGGSPNVDFALRNPVITCHCWAVNLSKQNPPWGKANDLAESIVYGVYDPEQCRTQVLTLGPSGNQVGARVLEAWLITEPTQAPSDEANTAHFIVDIQLSWVAVDL